MTDFIIGESYADKVARFLGSDCTHKDLTLDDMHIALTNAGFKDFWQLLARYETERATVIEYQRETAELIEELRDLRNRFC